MSMITRLRDEQGFTLIEMAVAALLFGVLSVIVGSILITSTTAERTVRSVTSATTAGQLVTRTVEDTITNSATPLSLTTVGTSDLLLRARTAGKDAALSWTCTAFYYSASDKTIRYTSSTSAIGTVTATSQRSWTLLADGVARQGTTAIFALSGTTGVSLNFTVDTGTSNPVAFSSAVTSRTAVQGSSPCY